jgi:hypothetical protein
LTFCKSFSEERQLVVMLFKFIVSSSKVTVSMPPPPSTTPQTNTDLVEGPHKRRLTERVTDNGDPLARKKARIITASGNSKSKSSTKATTVARRIAVEVVPERSPHPHPRLDQILEAADDTDDKLDSIPVSTPGLEASETNNSINGDDEDEEPEKEDDITELSMCHVYLFVSRQHTNTTIERLSKKLDAPVYAFFKPSPTVEYVAGCKAHVFECAVSQVQVCAAVPLHWRHQFNE